jgi:hypothetical protein
MPLKTLVCLLGKTMKLELVIKLLQIKNFNTCITHVGLRWGLGDNAKHNAKTTP